MTNPFKIDDKPVPSEDRIFEFISNTNKRCMILVIAPRKTSHSEATSFVALSIKKHNRIQNLLNKEFFYLACQYSESRHSNAVKMSNLKNHHMVYCYSMRNQSPLNVKNLSKFFHSGPPLSHRSQLAVTTTHNQLADLLDFIRGFIPEHKIEVILV